MSATIITVESILIVSIIGKLSPAINGKLLIAQPATSKPVIAAKKKLVKFSSITNNLTLTILAPKLI